MNHNLIYELILLGEKQALDENNESNIYLSRLISNDYLSTLKQDCMRDVWNTESIPTDGDFENYLKRIVVNFITENDGYSSNERQLIVLIQGISFLQLFVQNNWIGPPTSETTKEIIEPLLIKTYTYFSDGSCNMESKLNEIAVKSLSDETLLMKVKSPEYLWLSRLLLCSCKSHLYLCASASWWGLRCIYIHQQILDDRMPFLAEMAETFIKTGTTAEPLMTDEKLRYLQIQFHLEASYILSYYYKMDSSKEHFNTAEKLTGVSFHTTGALGKRTYHQLEDKSQLLLRIERQGDSKHTEASASDSISFDEIPKDLHLNDSARMESIVFKEKVEGNEENLIPVEQAVLLNIFNRIRKSNAVDNLTKEELLVYLTPILSQPKNWAIQTVALYLRSILEGNHHRTVERAMMQLQVLVDNFSKSSPKVTKRNNLFYCVGFPPIWQIEQKLADMYKKLGVFSSALEIYLKLEKWENVIRCYYHLNQKHKAEEIIRSLLKVKETPSMLCFLGDVTNDAQHYLQAWELSGHRSARAQKGLGQLHFNKKRYSECISHFKKSLEINYLQLEVWSCLAYAAMQLEDWQLTAEAYRKCLNLESDNFLAWNNLANAYIKMNQKPRAWKALQEALKCNYDDWKIWENYLLVSTDCGAFDEVLTAYHRILDLKDKHTDCEVLGVLVKAIAENLPDNSGKPARCYLTNTLQLFGRLTSQVLNNSTLWLLYAELTSLTDEGSGQYEKVAQYLERAYRCANNQKDWEKESDKRQSIFDLTLKLSNVYLKCSETADKQQSLQFLTSGKLALKGIASKLKHQNTSQLVQSDEIESQIAVLNDKIKEFETAIAARK